MTRAVAIPNASRKLDANWMYKDEGRLTVVIIANIRPIPTNAPISTRKQPPPSARSKLFHPNHVPAAYRPTGPPAMTQLKGHSYHHERIVSSAQDSVYAFTARFARAMQSGEESKTIDGGVSVRSDMKVGMYGAVKQFAN